MHRAIEKLPFNPNGIVERNFNMIDVYDHETDLHFEVSREKPIITMMMRADLDNLIILEAVKKGAKVNDGVKVLNLVNNDDVIEVVTGSTTLKADFVIAADGATGISAKISGMNKNFFSVPAIECEVYLPEVEF